jgi:hypothetical protein
MPGELARLATEYLRRQRKLWPELVKAGLLPEVSEENIAAMIEDFKKPAPRRPRRSTDRSAIPEI